MDANGRQGRGRRLIRRVALDGGVAALALLLGFAGWAITHRVDEPRKINGIIGEPSSGAPALQIDHNPPSVEAPGDPAPLFGGGAADGRTAVERYLTAEAAGHTDASYLLLSLDDRRSYGSPAKWENAHASLLPIVGFELGDVSEEATQVVVDAVLDLTPTLNVVVGNTPARADATWTAVFENEAWYVSLGASEVAARWPSDAGVADAAERWADGRQRCTAAGQIDSLLGSPNLAEPLCGSTEPVTISAPKQLRAEDSAAVVVAAFGGDANEWARVVDVRGPVSVSAVLAPVGDDWLVIGVFAPSS